MIVSTEGGMNIEDVARDNPDAIIRVPVDINNGILSLSVLSILLSLEVNIQGVIL